ADVAGVEEGRARGVHLGDEGVRGAVVGQVGPDRHGEGGLRRKGVAGDVRVPGTVDGDAEAGIVAGPADVAGVEEGRARGVHLRDERVRGAVIGQVRPHGHGEARLRRASGAGDVRVPAAVDGDAPAVIETCPADVAGVEEARA